MRTPGADERRTRALNADGMTTAVEAATILAKMRKDPNAKLHRDELVRALGWRCTVPDCERQSRTLAMCDTHYRAYRRLVQERTA